MSSLFLSVCPKCHHFLCLCVPNVITFCVCVSQVSSLFMSVCPKCHHFLCLCVPNVIAFNVCVSQMSSIFMSLCPKCTSQYHFLYILSPLGRCSRAESQPKADIPASFLIMIMIPWITRIILWIRKLGDARPIRAIVDSQLNQGKFLIPNIANWEDLQ